MISPGAAATRHGQVRLRLATPVHGAPSVPRGPRWLSRATPLLPLWILLACASTPAGGAAGAGSTTGVAPRPPAAEPEGGAIRVYPGFAPETFGTEPLALLPPARISLPPDLAVGAAGEDLRRELETLVLDRLPEEVRILHQRAPVLAFGDWARQDPTVERSGFVGSILAWEGSPGPDGAIPETVGNSAEALGDARGIRFFLLPRSLTVLRRDTFDYAAALEGFLLDSRGERVVWAGTGYAAGTLPQSNTEQILTGVVREAAVGAVADLAAKLPGDRNPGVEEGFSDVQR